MPPSFAEMRLLQNVWVLQKWLGNFLTVEEVTERRMTAHKSFCFIGKDWHIDGGNVQMKWHTNGQIFYLENWQDGKRHGLTEVWYENGQLRLREILVNGKRNGPIKFISVLQ